ncbi:hypothetical protein Nepgr_008455 [Nepenthes gracilis]|uniref:MLO-like protein n=1 Tax=Nepenthes gracilis TaxID=150966 RepID=A0AAD3XJE2_NEPGR|nr:hypothetical protein Nepgr_008455 [Nepenthes gracilis]
MAGNSGSSTAERKLDQTPTWAVAGVCFVIIVISILLEMVLHKIGKWFSDRHKRALYEALEKVKSELMVMGFISLLLTFSQSYISKICVPSKLANTMLPCPYDGENDNTTSTEESRRLLWNGRRFLASDSSTPQCNLGYEPLISTNGIHQLHILIFFLAVFHVIYSAITMMLGRLKIRGWKEWERETSSQDYEFSNDPSRFRLTHETSFVRAHNSFWARIPFFFYVGCFLRQFFRSVTKADYLTLRNGFITAHIAPGSKFDFQKYIKRSLEDDFKVVVGVSPVLWASFVIFLFLNVNGWHTLFWASLIPSIIIVAVGTKLQAILTKMALEITERHAVVQGIPLVLGSDKYFWFSWPQLLLHLLHFTLFQNAFQITYFLWIWYEFGLKSCFHDRFVFVLIKLALGVSALCLCSYITLPLYALVTQMGSHMKKSVFDEQTTRALKKWHKTVKKQQQGEKAVTAPSRTFEGSSSFSTLHTSGRTLHRLKTTGHSTNSSPREKPETSDYEADGNPSSPRSLTANFVVRIDLDDDREAEMTARVLREGGNQDRG